MTAEPASATRVVTFQRAEHPHWADGYWDALVGVDVRMPALMENGRVLAGFLVAVEESETEIRLSFEGLQAES